MSYREIRNFTEVMRELGYPRLISMENFRKPNFELVADILYWMVKLYDPETTISDRVEFENERVEFLTGIANLMATKARLKLNTKKLYASDGRAVQELLKLATLLYKASKSTGIRADVDNPPPQIKVQDVKATRLLASEITQTGAKVHDLLANEATERQERARAIRFLDQAASSTDGSQEQAYVERSIRELIDSSKQSVIDMRKECEELEADERNIDSKIKKKQDELERTEKRLRSLENVRPQFMDEIEKLEKELQRHYDIYMEKYRNLDYLEHESQKHRKNEEERKEEQERRLKKMRERLLKEEVDLLRGGRGGDGDGDDDTGRVAKNGISNSRNSGRGGGGGAGRGGGRMVNAAERGPGRGQGSIKVQGNMRGDSEDDSSGGEGDVSGSKGDLSDEDLSVNSAAKRRGPGPGTRGSANVNPASHRAGRARGSARGGGSEGDSDEFFDDDDEDDDDEGEDGDESGGSDDAF